MSTLFGEMQLDVAVAEQKEVREDRSIRMRETVDFACMAFGSTRYCRRKGKRCATCFNMTKLEDSTAYNVQTTQIVFASGW